MFQTVVGPESALSPDQILRLLRLMRLARLIRLVRVFKELWLVVSGLMESCKVLGWVRRGQAGAATGLTAVL